MAMVIGEGITFDSAALKTGVRFDTPYETGCQVVTGPDDVPSYEPHGTFYALDSEGVECLFTDAMVSWIHK